MRNRLLYYLIFLGAYLTVIFFVHLSRRNTTTQREVIGLAKLEEESKTGTTVVNDTHSINVDLSSDGHASVEETKSNEHKNTSNRVRLMDIQHDAILFPKTIEQFDFRKCDMLTCFNLDLCRESSTLKVHIVTNSEPKMGASDDLIHIPGESNVIHKKILQIIRQSRHYEPDPSKACLLVPEEDILDRDPLSTSFRKVGLDIYNPENGYGMNYLIFNLYSGTWPDYRENDFSGFKLGAGLLAKASNSESHHRLGYDISIPLFSYSHPMITARNHHHDMPEKSDQANKTYFLTFKGKRYVFGSGSDTRNSLYHLNNERDILMLTTCRHGKKWREVEDERCQKDENDYDKHDFTDLMMRSTFCLIPRGRRLGSFRFLEALNHTCIPVVLADGWVWPFDEIIDWSGVALQFPEEDLFLVPDRLRDISDKQIKAMQVKCREFYESYFASVERIVLTALGIIESRIQNMLANKPSS